MNDVNDAKPKVDLAREHARAVERIRNCFGAALPSDFEVRYELALDLGSSFGTAQRDRSLPGRRAYLVRLNPHMMLRATPEQTIETLVHEICHCADHAIVGCMGHGPSWRMLMKLMGYIDPQRCHSIAASDMRGRGEKGHVRCSDCGRSVLVTLRQKEAIARGRKTKKRCHCGGKLFVPE